MIGQAILAAMAAMASFHTTSNDNDLEDAECRKVAILAYLEAQRDNPDMDRAFYAAIGSQAYDNCIQEKAKTAGDSPKLFSELPVRQ